MDFLHELKWRGLLHNNTPGVEAHLRQEGQRAYIGFDPTADSLHVGNLVQIMTLVHLQNCRHRPIVLIGGATGMVGDPSGKKTERDLLQEDALRHNEKCIKAQLERFLHFEHSINPAEMVNNHDWFKGIGFLQFVREVGKHITVNYMLAKDSVKNRLENGLSFAEFSYQLVQGYDFFWLNQNKGCKLQLGGSDQWGNITTGIELIRRMNGEEAYAITTPLLTKADGTKFGKSEDGNIWLDAERTSPYKFYQFWLNSTDEDAVRFIKIFTTFSEGQCERLIIDHMAAPGKRMLQKELAAHITFRVHGPEKTKSAIELSNILFSNDTKDLLTLSEAQLEDLFNGIPHVGIARGHLMDMSIVEFISDTTGFLSSRGEAKRALKEGGISLNNTRVNESYRVTVNDLLRDKYIMLRRGRKTDMIVWVLPK